ncbi:MAG TPA: aminotransferase class I/II-fold pyridoxal phosphate-dependent enzyme [Pseudomonadota bacterium]|nr:aminotransferase class I/II-fold pyridoxal phosphate-dependent enzyme [Pseudomonadota bacterium]
MRIGSRLGSFAISDIRAMSIACQAVGGINLGQGICDLPTPPKVAQGATQAIADRQSTYSHPCGVALLRQAVADKVRTLYGLSYDPESEVVVTSGATGGFASALLALCEPGDEVILFEPYYGYHLNSVLMLGLTPVLVPLLPPDWTLTKEALEKAVSKKTRAIVVCTPSNPSGKVFSETERGLLADFCTSHDVIAFCDEIYEHIVFSGHKHVPLSGWPGMRERSVTMSGLSKTFSITGWRLGYLTTTAEAARRIAIAHDLLYVCAPTPLQHGGLLGLLHTPPAFYSDLSALYEHKRDVLCRALEDAGLSPLWPAGAYYVLADARRLGCNTAKEAAMKLLKEAGIAAIPGTSFFTDPVGENLLRFCFAKPDEVLEQAAARLRKL